MPHLGVVHYIFVDVWKQIHYIEASKFWSVRPSSTCIIGAKHSYFAAGLTVQKILCFIPISF
jgi:hypothetical protein